MRWPVRDYYRWRYRFAWRPRRFGEMWIWLESYRFRPVPSDEVQARIPDPYPYLYSGPYWLEEFQVRGRSTWRLTRHLGLALAGPVRTWINVRPYLREVA
jgi:hypothetical protein